MIYNHSSQGLGHSPNKHSAFVYTKAMLARKLVVERGVMESFEKYFSFLICIK